MQKDQITRYARQIALDGIGVAGQQKIMAAKILVVGAGGLGCPVLESLAAAGIGELHIVDDDLVELSNLHRQFLHSSDDIGRPKVESAKESLARINPDARIIPHYCRIDTDNAGSLVAGMDLVIDGCDNFDTRFLVNDACLAASVPLVSAAVNGFDGQLAVFDPAHAEDAPCYRCFVPEKPAIPVANCAQSGVFGALTATLGAMAAMEALKLVTGTGTVLRGKVLIHDALTMGFRQFGLPRDPDCPACKQ